MSYENYLTWRSEPAPLTPDLSVVIPTYNERERIVPTISSIIAHLATTDLDYEIVVSDDGSSDGTPDLVRSLGLRNVVVLDPGVNRGKGAAVRAGVRAAGGRLILFSDADLSTPIEEVDAMLVAARDADVVIGSRGADGAAESAKSRLRHVMSAGARLATRVGLGLDAADTQCGFKLFRRNAAVALFGTQRIDGFSFDAEVLFLADRLGFRVVELPVQWVDAPGSTVRPLKTAIAFLFDIVRIRMAALTGRYSVTAATTTEPEPGLRLAVVTALPPSTQRSTSTASIWSTSSHASPRSPNWWCSPTTATACRTPRRSHVSRPRGASTHCSHRSASGERCAGTNPTWCCSTRTSPPSGRRRWPRRSGCSCPQRCG